MSDIASPAEARLRDEIREFDHDASLLRTSGTENEFGAAAFDQQLQADMRRAFLAGLSYPGRLRAAVRQAQNHAMQAVEGHNRVRPNDKSWTRSLQPLLQDVYIMAFGYLEDVMRSPIAPAIQREEPMPGKKLPISGQAHAEAIRRFAEKPYAVVSVFTNLFRRLDEQSRNDITELMLSRVSGWEEEELYHSITEIIANGLSSANKPPEQTDAVLG